jgi:hydroxyethylthiazole kinase-like uncharacterized protein yjeF
VSREIITVAQMRAIDAGAARAGVATRTLMENAGRAVADVVMQRFTARPTAVLTGPGNNGGDGWVAARILKDHGWPVWVETLAPVEQLLGDAADAARAWTGATYPIGADNPMAELFIDALFGAGLAKPLSGEPARLAQALAQSPERVVAIDVPSGLDGDTGRPRGDVSFRAGCTVTFVRKKPAHVLMPGCVFCGEVVVRDIGVPFEILESQQLSQFENDPCLWPLPWPDKNAHKHARGHVFVASGDATRTGAARLAARAALRVGAGLVTVLSPSDAMSENAAQLTAVMLREACGAQDYAVAAAEGRCLLIGPAFGTTTTHGEKLAAALAAPNRAPMVLDADAITLLAPLQQQFSPSDVLTPHVGEFNRAFLGALDAASNRIEAARSAAAGARCVVLLKGPDTVIVAPDGRAIVNTIGSPFLATAGSGDVLAGFIAGLIGQGMPSFDAAAAGAWLHGRCGALAGPGLIAEDLPELLPIVLNDLAPEPLKAASAGR